VATVVAGVPMDALLSILEGIRVATDAALDDLRRE
jgi:hypothetical protein